MDMRLRWMGVGRRTRVGIVCGCNIDREGVRLGRRVVFARSITTVSSESHGRKDLRQRSLRSEHRWRREEVCATYVSLHSIDKPRYEPQNCVCLCSCARMAELADALASGASGRKVVEVRVLFRAPFFNSHPLRTIRLTGQ